MAEQETKLRPLVRICNTDLKGEKDIQDGLRKIKGVSFMFSNLILSLANIEGKIKTGLLTETQIEKINRILKNPIEEGVPVWFLNRRNDYDEGKDLHIITTDIAFTKSNDIKRLQSIRARNGLRHAWRLPLRGQRTQSNFRKNKGKGIAGKKKTTVRK